MAIEVFSRYESKYLIDCRTYEKLQPRLLNYMELDTYNKQHETYSICNIYYDTDDNQLIHNSLQKPKYKEKLRLRSYGTTAGDSMVYLEIKKKFCNLVNKRRSALFLDEAYEFLNSGKPPFIKPHMNKQVLSEIEYILQQYELKPKVFLAYNRRAYFGAGHHDLRISFDTAITTRRTDLKLESGIYGKKLLDDDMTVMEIKTAQSMPLWLTRLLSSYEIYPRSFSKYGAEYMNSINHTSLEKDVVCIPSQTRCGILLPA